MYGNSLYPQQNPAVQDNPAPSGLPVSKPPSVRHRGLRRSLSAIEDNESLMVNSYLREVFGGHDTMLLVGYHSLSPGLGEQLPAGIDDNTRCDLVLELYHPQRLSRNRSQKVEPFPLRSPSPRLTPEHPGIQSVYSPPSHRTYPTVVWNGEVHIAPLPPRGSVVYAHWREARHSFFSKDQSEI